MSYKLAVGTADFDLINVRCEQLGAEWGAVCIMCDGKTCVVHDPLDQYWYEAETLLEALNNAAEDMGL